MEIEQSGRLTVEEAAALLSRLAGISIKPRTVYGWAARRLIPSWRIGGRVLFDAGELAAFVQSTRVGPTIPRLMA